MDKSFLSKKSFHPGRLENRAKVWEAEKKKEEEEHKIQLLKKERAEEEQKEYEERKKAEEQGLKYVKRVNWIYETPSGYTGEDKVEQKIIEKKEESHKIDTNQIKSNQIKTLQNDPLNKKNQDLQKEARKIMNNSSKLRDLEIRQIKKLVTSYEYYSSKNNESELEKIKEKLWLVSEKGKVGDDEIKKNVDLWSWWKDRYQDEKLKKLEKEKK